MEHNILCNLLSQTCRKTCSQYRKLGLRSIETELNNYQVVSVHCQKRQCICTFQIRFQCPEIHLKISKMALSFVINKIVNQRKALRHMQEEMDDERRLEKQARQTIREKG